MLFMIIREHINKNKPEVLTPGLLFSVLLLSKLKK